MRVQGMLKNVVQLAGPAGASVFMRGKLLAGDLADGVVWVISARTGRKVGIPISDWKWITEAAEVAAPQKDTAKVDPPVVSNAKKAKAEAEARAKTPPGGQSAI